MKDRIIEYNEYLKTFSKNDFIYIESIETDFSLTQQKLFENIESIRRIYYITYGSNYNYFIQAMCRPKMNYPSITWTKGIENFSCEEIERTRKENEDIDLVVIEDFNKLINVEFKRGNYKHDVKALMKEYLKLFKKFNCPVMVFESFRYKEQSLCEMKFVDNVENNRPILKEALNYFSNVKAFANKNIFEPYQEEPFYYDCYDVKKHEKSFVSLIEYYDDMKYVTEGDSNGITLDFINYWEKAAILNFNELDCNCFALNCVKEDLNARK